MKLNKMNGLLLSLQEKIRFMKKILLIAPAFLLFACGGESETDNTKENEETTTVEETVVEEEPTPTMTKDAEIMAYLEEKGWEGKRDESGMYVVIDEPGTGEERPTLTDEVTIFYQGYLLDGTQFDGTGEEPATFPLSNLIAGWQIGIPMFGKGGKGKLIIPSELAYGERDNRDIPGGSTLMFEIELIDWAPAM